MRNGCREGLEGLHSTQILRIISLAKYLFVNSFSLKALAAALTTIYSWLMMMFPLVLMLINFSLSRGLLLVLLKHHSSTVSEL